MYLKAVWQSIISSKDTASNWGKLSFKNRPKDENKMCFPLSKYIWFVNGWCTWGLQRYWASFFCSVWRKLFVFRDSDVLHHPIFACDVRKIQDNRIAALSMLKKMLVGIHRYLSQSLKMILVYFRVVFWCISSGCNVGKVRNILSERR